LLLVAVGENVSKIVPQEDDDRGGLGDLRFLATRMENEAGVKKQH
jgi:hypothetical protein